MKTVHVAAGIIRKEGSDELLAVQRGYGDMQGLWEFPGGKLMRGETPEDAVRRELMEELQVKVNNLRDFYTVEYDYPDFHLSMECYYCSLAKESDEPQKHDRQLDIRWIPRTSLATVEWMPADKGLIDALIELKEDRLEINGTANDAEATTADEPATKPKRAPKRRSKKRPKPGLLDGIDTGVDSTANDITPFRAIMNDMYAKDISKKIKSVKRDKQRKGQFIGGKPVYGYKMHPTEKNKIVIDEEVAPIVRRIFALALSGMSCRSIAVQLNQEGVPTPATYANLPVARPGPYTGLWSSERISDMLQNETYIGNMVQGRSVKISYKSKKCLKQDRANWVVVEGTHEAIIDRELFQTVQRGLRGFHQGLAVCGWSMI